LSDYDKVVKNKKIPIEGDKQPPLILNIGGGLIIMEARKTCHIYYGITTKTKGVIRIA